MKYTKEQRLDIAKRVYDGELTVEEAAVKYDLNPSSVKGYLRLYRAETGLPLQIASLNGHLCHIWRPACDLNGGQPRTH